MVIIAETLQVKGDHLEISSASLQELIEGLQDLAKEAEDHGGYRVSVVTGAGVFNVQVVP